MVRRGVNWIMTRRQLIATAAAALVMVPASRLIGAVRAATRTSDQVFEITKTDAEWKQLLTPAQYDVLRKHGTERSGSSPLNGEHRKGVFVCAACALPLFSSDTKFDSGIGWPSFWAPLPNGVGTRLDQSLLEARTEVHCRRCGGHIGHVFNDGPRPTGLRYCMNGVAMTFRPAR